MVFLNTPIQCITAHNRNYRSRHAMSGTIRSGYEKKILVLVLQLFGPVKITCDNILRLIKNKILRQLFANEFQWRQNSLLNVFGVLYAIEDLLLFLIYN